MYFIILGWFWPKSHIVIHEGSERVGFIGTAEPDAGTQFFYEVGVTGYVNGVLVGVGRSF